eukprot:CAMPEP_0197588844 /NCGR_PEP_ID=MMETSP1326-20131121/9989_1 /TAXON_ID=1155430 /ORGANISM="Genus nov. species nov., Strain RCC2288" /LENGTH=100 /DNA_ID=CAMNT_0043153717 /DNA_START=336 /DNA_END=634 /DNA_ORIENTATION=+
MPRPPYRGTSRGGRGALRAVACGERTHNVGLPSTEASSTRAGGVAPRCSPPLAGGESRDASPRPPPGDAHSALTANAIEQRRRGVNHQNTVAVGSIAKPA